MVGGSDDGYKVPENPPEEIEIKEFALFRQKWYYQNELYDVDIQLFDSEPERERRRIELIHLIKETEIQMVFDNIRDVQCPF
jgi:hypothetical protein